MAARVTQARAARGTHCDGDSVTRVTRHAQRPARLTRLGSSHSQRPAVTRRGPPSTPAGRLRPPVVTHRGRPSLAARQWPEVSDFVARFCTVRESKNTLTCENRVRFSHSCDSRMSVCCLTCATCKKVWLKSYTSSHCLLAAARFPLQ